MPDDLIQRANSQAIADALGSSPITLTATETDPPILTLGTAIGLLIEDPNAKGTFTLNPDWFADPIGATGDGLASGGPALAALIAQLIGQASGSSLGIPAQAPANLGVWYPILNPSAQPEPKPTGLYIASTPTESGGSILGAGTLYQTSVTLSELTVSPAAAALSGPDTIALNVWGLVPLLKMDGGVDVALGTAEGAITIGFQVTAGDGETLITSNGFSFSGVRLTCDLSFVPSPAVGVSLVIENLTLPTVPVAKDYTLADLEAIGGDGLLALVAALAMGALTRAVGETPATGFILPAVGLGPSVPGIADVTLPILRWDQFATLAISGGDIAQPIRDWFTAIASDAAMLQAWLTAAGGLIANLTGTSPAVTGSGGRADPYEIPLFSISGIGALGFTVGTAVDANGLRHLYPGLSFQSSGTIIGNAAQFKAVAALELMDFLLTPGSSAASLTGNFSAGLQLSGATADAPLFSGSVGGQTYVFGSLTGGVTLLNPAGGVTLLPRFSLGDVTTPAGTYGSIDLLDPNELVTVAAAELGDALTAAFNSLFGTESTTVGQSLAALLGVGAPPVPQPQSWPADLAPPFGATGILTSLQDPVTAYSSYWARLIASSETINGQPPLYYMIAALGDLLTESGVSPGGVTGSGTAADPWRVALGPTGTVISLAAQLDTPDSGGTRLTAGLAAGSSVTLADAVPLDLLVTAGLLALTSRDGTIAEPTPFPRIAATLALPDGFTTPSVADAALSVGASSFVLSWGPATGWAWSMAVGAPALIVDGQTLPVGETMNYSDSSSLEDLVTQSGATFAPILTGVLGIALYRAQARAGLALDGWLGLLPNLGSFMPEGITWPESMPTLAPTGFTDPLGTVRAQLKALLSTPDQAQAALQLLGWAIDSSATTAAAIGGAGTQLSPYRLPLGLPAGIAGTLWQDDAQTYVTLGLGAQTETTIGSIVLRTDLRLDAFALDWASGTQTNAGGVPGLALAVTLANADGSPLVVTDQVSLATVGLMVGLSLSDGFSVTPSLFVTTTDEQAHAIGDSPSDVAVTTTLVNAGLQAALPSLQTSSQFAAIYGLLAQLGVMIPATGNAPAYGLDTDGWMALNSAGLSFLTTRFATVLTDADQTALLIQLLSDLSGIPVPTLPTPLAALLVGLDLAVPGSGGVVPNAEGIVSLAQNPGAALANALSALMSDASRRSLVMAELTEGFDQAQVGPITFTVQNGRTLTLSLTPENALSFGGFADLTGSVALDLVSGDLVLAADVYIPQVNAGIGTVFTAPLGGTPTATVSLTWGDGSTPMPAPLQILPFNADQFLTDLAQVAPAYALSVFISRVVEAKLLPDYPLARVLLQLFGLTSAGPENGTWVMKSTLGLFEDPVQWLLSDAVMGSDGTLNIAQIQSVLTSLPTGTAASGLSLQTTETGAILTGLPYGLEVEVSADPSGAGALTVTPRIAAAQPLAGGVSLETLSLGLTLSAACQPGLALGTSLSAPIPGLSQPLSVSGSYTDGIFGLSFGESGAGNPSVTLLPFLGWSSLVQQVASLAAQELLPTVTGELLTALRQAGAGALADSLQTAGTALEISDLLTALIAKIPDPVAMEQAALDWVKGRYATADAAAATAQAIAALFSPYVSGLTADGDGLVTYDLAPTLPLKLRAGLRTIENATVLGLWADSAVTVGDFATIGLAPTGGGINLSSGALVPSFGFNAQALIAGSEGPGLTAGLDGGLTLSVDPLMENGAASSLAVELLPQPFGVPSAQVGQAVQTWLAQVATLALPRYASALLLNTGAVRQWLDAPLFPSGSTLTAAQVLIGAGLIQDDKGTYVLTSLPELQALGIDGFLAGFLKTLTETQVKIVSLPQNGGIWLEPGSGSDTYGLRVQAPGMMLPGGGRFVFQLGATDTEWITLAGGSASIADHAGVSIYLPITNNAPDFGRVQVNLINIGVDFQGAGGQPLMDLSRFKMGAVKPRGLLTLDFSQSDPVTAYGGGFGLSDIQISLAPDTAVTGPNVNPVAQNLLGSGSSASSSDNPPVNPGFSVQAGWLNTGTLGVEFLNGDGQPSPELWIPVQRSFGPVHADRIGVGWDNATDVGSVMFDGNLSLAGLTVELVDLSVSVNFANITDYTQYSLDLGGLAVSFSGGSVSIAGGLFKQENPLRYDGMLLVKFSTFSLYAVGSFALIPINPDEPEGETAVSFFAFLNLNAPLGGIPAFFIEGLAGGFGVNRSVIVPGAGDILSFPLIQGAISADYFGEDASPAQALQKMGASVPPQVGAYWIAGGFKFSSFKLLTVFAMLLVRFGRGFEIDLIGLAQGSLPPQLPPSKSLAYIELGVVASFKPDEGEISVTAQLTPNSFLLTKSCKLTGGFAAEFWYGKSPQAGDFVITLGGYHPAFTPPDYYPTVPRLGFNWPVLDEAGMSVKVYGGAYFALTPSMVMAGAEMKASFTAGPLSAWFEAGADFLIAWQPFYYMANIRISVGAALTIEAFGVKCTLSAELGAKLELWGPETAGRVKVNWYVISFTIPFGNQDEDTPSTKPLDWDQFVTLMLPSGQGDSGTQQAARTLGDSAATPVILTVQVTTGLLGTDDNGDAVVDARPLVITLASAIPPTLITPEGGDISPLSGASVGVRPMEVTEVTTPVTVTLQAYNSQTGGWDSYPLDASQFTVTGTDTPAPGALWSQDAFDPQGLPTADVVDGALTGAVLTTKSDSTVDPTPSMDLLQAFSFDQAPILPLPFAATPNFAAAAALPQTGAFAQLMQSVMAPTVIADRQTLWNAVIDHGLTAIPTPNLGILSQYADQIYVAPPAIAALSVDVAPAPTNPATSASLARAARPAVGAANPTRKVRAPRVLGTATAYTGAPATLGALFGGTAQAPRLSAAWRDHAPATVGSGLHVPVAPGCLAVIDLGTESPALRLDPGARVRLVELDRFGRVRADRRVDGGETLPVDSATAQIALIGDPSEPGALAGWTVDSPLFQASLATLLAPGCRLRLQASPRLRRQQRELKRGVLIAKDALARNQVQTTGGTLRAGWVETLFGSDIDAVTIVHRGPLPAVRLTTRTGLAPKDLGAVVVPTATERFGEEGVFVSTIALPDIAAGSETGVWLESGTGILAVLGTRGQTVDPIAIKAALTTAPLPTLGIPLPRAADRLARRGGQATTAAATLHIHAA